MNVRQKRIDDGIMTEDLTHVLGLQLRKENIQMKTMYGLLVKLKKAVMR